MFKNRQIQVSVVKKPKTDADDQTSEDEEFDYPVIIMAGAERLVKQIFTGVFTYIALDTVRQVIVARNTSVVMRQPKGL